MEYTSNRSKEGLNVDLQGGGGEGEIEAGDDLGVQHPQTPYHLQHKYHHLIFNCDKNSYLFQNKIQLMANNTGLGTVIKLFPYDWSELYLNNSIYKNFIK